MASTQEAFSSTIWEIFNSDGSVKTNSRPFIAKISTLPPSKLMELVRNTSLLLPSRKEEQNRGERKEHGKLNNLKYHKSKINTRVNEFIVPPCPGVALIFHSMLARMPTCCTCPWRIQEINMKQ